MASIAMRIGGAVLNAAAFTGGNYLAKFLAGDNGKAALDEKTRHDKALESYQSAMAKYSRERTQLLDWINTNEEIKEHAQKNFTNTDYAFKLYNQAHPDQRLTLPKASCRNRVSFFLSVVARSRSDTRLFVFFELLCRKNNGRQTRQNLLQPSGLLERHLRHQKIGRSCESS